ncbi:MAG: gluconate 2-dehydrogenase subunit 3 family protein [Pelagibacterales bacterium]|nr:gluconate 2-dehydrogenase subunit 3 family protein [Pelagibacterales bacterium]
MDRRETIKNILLGSIGSSVLLESCVSSLDNKVLDKIWKYQYGRTPEEKKRDNKFLNSIFFTESELQTIEKIANIVLPPNKFGDINDAGVVEMFEFIAKDWSTPAHNDYGEKVLRRGLIVFNQLCVEKFGSELLNCTEPQIKVLFDEISYEDNSLKNQKESVKLFATYRGMIVTGYFTSEVGIKDLGYKGNTPNVWDGVPDEVLEQYKGIVSYDKEWIDKCVDQSKRGDIAEWDNQGNLLT